MRLVVGLGNPGEEYRQTRHNIGAMLLRHFASQEGIGEWKRRFLSEWGTGNPEGAPIGLLFPQTFMNRSGEAVAQAMRFYKLETKFLMVMHDDIDFPLGRVQAEFNAGAAGHKGVLSIMDHLGSREFYRIRLGVGRPRTKEDVEQYVLSPFDEHETKRLGDIFQQGERLIREWMVS